MLQGLMDEIENYITATYSPELRGEIRASLMVFEAFEYNKPFDDFPDVLYDVDADNADLTMGKFVVVITNHLNALLQMHKLTLVEDADLATRNQVCAALYRLQHLEDPVPTLRILETTDLDNVDKFSRILAQLTTISEPQLLATIESVDPIALELLANLLYDQEEKAKKIEAENMDDLKLKQQLLANLKDFFLVCGTDNLGFELVENGVLLGHPATLYYPYIGEQLVTENDDQTALNLLSFFFLASDTYNAPLESYRSHSEQLINGHARIMNIETLIARHLNDLRQYQKARDDARQVSSAGHTPQTLHAI